VFHGSRFPFAHYLLGGQKDRAEVVYKISSFKSSPTEVRTLLRVPLAAVWIIARRPSERR